jgi:hypothetical protein
VTQLSTNYTHCVTIKKEIIDFLIFVNQIYGEWMNAESLYCSYYQAHVERELCWLVTAGLRSYEHISFDRTLDPETSLFEFFVPRDCEKYFLTVMTYFEEIGLVRNLCKMPNRLESAQEV